MSSDNIGQACRVGREPGSERRHIGQLVIGKTASEDHGEFGLAAPVMCQRQQVDHQPACRTLGALLEQPVEGPGHRLRVGTTGPGR